MKSSGRAPSAPRQGSCTVGYMNAEALLPVGKDCDCGNPLVWWHGEQYCAVYGTHPAWLITPAPQLEDVGTRWHWNRVAPFAALVAALTKITADDAIDKRLRHLKAVS